MSFIKHIKVVATLAAGAAKFSNEANADLVPGQGAFPHSGTGAFTREENHA